MHVYCSKCHYDSGDFEDSHEIAQKVNDDGGHMEMAYDSETGKPRGWNIVCPKCGDDDHGNDNMHID